MKFPGWAEEDELWRLLEERIDLEPGTWHGRTFGSRRYEILITRPLETFLSGTDTLEKQAEQIVGWALKNRKVLLGMEVG
jgi:hypothetical protein